MSVPRPFLLRRSPWKFSVLRSLCTAPESSSSITRKHDFLPPSTYIASWKPCRNPKEAAKQLSLLRREYDLKFRELRKQYIEEMEMQRVEKRRKEEARKAALRIANEDRKALKDAKKKAEAIERQAAEEEFRQLLMKERAEKVEYWRAREEKWKEKKKEKIEVVRRQSSVWIDEAEIERKALNALTDPIRF
ncbi:hypothetical protein M569_03992 [Genlisea aurea]|uniref:Uncharacterized protein n=1 Tax=Genlisea aurea TaxID=192259 RepID=S8CTZ0_9LAMI|nr:hypothetical protein M569_03992 [Genlisea aurea]